MTFDERDEDPGRVQDTRLHRRVDRGWRILSRTADEDGSDASSPKTLGSHIRAAIAQNLPDVNSILKTSMKLPLVAFA